jgi:hypothetical protein
MKDVFLAYLSATLNADTGSLAENLFKISDDGVEVLQDNALSYLNTLHSTHVQTLKNDAKQSFDEGYKKAEKIVKTSYDKKLRAIFDVKGPLEGDELFTAIAASKDAITDEQRIKNSPLFVSKERELEQVKADHEKEKVQIVEQFKAEQSKARANEIGVKKAKEIALSMNPVLPANATVAENNLNVTLNTLLSGLEFNVDESGNVVSILKGGARYENQHGHPYTIEMLLKEQIPTYYELRAQSDKGNGGNANSDPNPQKPNQNPGGPKTRQEFDEAIAGKTIVEVAAIAAQYEANITAQ